MVERTADGRIRTTEWEDLQYKHGNRVGKYRDNELKIVAQRISDANPDVELVAYDPQEERVRDKISRGGYDLSEEELQRQLNAHLPDANRDERGPGDDDDDELAAIRRKRLAELKKQSQTNIYGVVKRIAGSDYVDEITKASEHCNVVAILVKDANRGCETLLAVMRSVAQRNRDVKFVSLAAESVMPNFPEKHLPCVLAYQKGALKEQLTGLAPWTEHPNREKSDTTVESVERLLHRIGMIRREEYDDEDDA